MLMLSKYFLVPMRYQKLLIQQCGHLFTFIDLFMVKGVFIFFIRISEKFTCFEENAVIQLVIVGVYYIV